MERLSILLIATVMAFNSFPFRMPVQSPDELVDSGTCGAQCVWKLSSDGILTISGDGSMADYGTSSTREAPYRMYQDQITAVVVEEGVTRIGQCAFVGLRNVKQVALADSIETISYEAFYGDRSLTEIEIPSSVKHLDAEAFLNCAALEKVILHEGLQDIGDMCFYDADALKELTIPASVTYIGELAFGRYSLDNSYIGGGIAKDETICGYPGTAAERLAFQDGLHFTPLLNVSSGDVNGDGEVDVFDVAFMKRYLDDPDSSLICLYASDLNADMMIDSTDCRRLNDYILAKAR